ncbi:sodium-dependent serotonin transporter-like isoform X2 [Maniola jurtina]|uniref:sodium-dependent serotonin transporter-like isoform X2 n=1 Tax=Maniola jurtina TaxID=191418 RepID=UPI001E68E58D|nr:sodium-dependent serotonin transporter-like isoform X2 [Maniola jurtina]
MANPNSQDTIFAFENREAQSQWSEVWSTTHIPTLDNASGGVGGAKGRRKLRLGSLALGAFLTMHCRVSASALTGGFFVFMLFLILATVVLANPLRHFEVYLGQWSISGPGRAFRVLPVFEGIGIAICINALVRAIVCCTIAAITAIYVTHSVADSKLPNTYCRNFDLKPYNPILKEINLLMLRESRFSLATGNFAEDENKTEYVTVGTQDFAWRNASTKLKVKKSVEVVLFREDYNFGQFNMPLVLCIILIWGVLWLLLVAERLNHGKLIWNNMSTWLVFIPWIWAVLLLICAIVNLASMPKSLRKIFEIGAKEVFAGMADALEVALYIHSASMGTEIIHGKGLNHFASGHIDPHLGGENVWHSGLLLLMSALHVGSAASCAVVDCIQPNTKRLYDMNESTLWIIPMYSKCTLVNNYSHFMSVLIFSGLTFSYMTVAFVLVKTSLHTIFEYKVKLVFAEQMVVAGIILSCMGLSLIFATTAGVALLESVDAIMTGVAMPFVCLLELVALMYVYRSHDFVSDMNVATEENACASRIGTQWQMIPAITLVTLIMKLTALCRAEMPRSLLWMSTAPLAAVVVAAPIRAVRNICGFLRQGHNERR